MPWYVFAILCAVFTGASGLIEKRALRFDHTMEYSTTFSILRFLILIPLIFKLNFNIPANLIAYTFIAAFFTSIAFLFWAKALRHMNISLAAPITGLEPVVTVILAYFFLKEYLSIVQIFGIVLLFIGVYILETHQHYKGTIIPLKDVLKSRHLIILFFSVISFSIASLFSRDVLKQVDPFTFVFLSAFFIMINYNALTFILYEGWHDIKKGLQKIGLYALTAAIISVLIYYTASYAMSLAYVGLVIAIKRSSILIQVILGGTFFHEKYLTRKIVAAAIIVVSVFLIII